jgi:hypothetical protein
MEYLIILDYSERWPNSKTVEPSRAGWLDARPGVRNKKGAQ